MKATKPKTITGLLFLTKNFHVRGKLTTRSMLLKFFDLRLTSKVWSIAVFRLYFLLYSMMAESCPVISH